jgi:hypothetical protein
MYSAKPVFFWHGPWLERPFLWALRTLMHMQSEKRRVTTMYMAKPVISGMIYAGEALSMGSAYLDAHAE